MTGPNDWQKAQGAKCPCRGSDDMCACQNVDAAHRLAHSPAASDGLRIMLPPAANVPAEYLEGWCEGQQYLIDNNTALLPAGDAPDRARGRLEGLEEAAVIKLLRQLEFTEDGYSLRTPYDGDVDDDTGRSVVVGGELVATFVDSDEGEELIAAIRALRGEGS